MNLNKFKRTTIPLLSINDELDNEVVDIVSDAFSVLFSNLAVVELERYCDDDTISLYYMHLKNEKHNLEYFLEIAVPSDEDVYYLNVFSEYRDFLFKKRKYLFHFSITKDIENESILNLYYTITEGLKLAINGFYNLNTNHIKIKG